MTRLYLIRHGEPSLAWGDAGEGANADPGLSETGHFQANAAASVLRAAGKLAVWSSPMRRCQQTAAALTPSGQFRIEARVTEVAAPESGDRGNWLKRTFPRAFDPAAAETLWTDCGPEIAAWRAGVVEALMGAQSDVAIFTHFIAINAALGAALDRSDAICFRPAHASITVLELEAGRLRLVSRGAETP